jgi:hypothetical protein
MTYDYPVYELESTVFGNKILKINLPEGVDIVSMLDMTEVVPSHKEGKDAPINLIGSEIVPGYHAPVLDMDFPVHVMPSRTPGHSHLYIDKLISWDDYAKLLTLMGEIGLIEKGYADSALARKETYVRIPDPSYL